MDCIVTDLMVARGGRTVLTGVNLHVRAGTALILRGPNGIGKTTLLRTIAGLQPAQAGRVAPTPDRITYAAHADAVKAALSVRENLQFWSKVYGSRRLEQCLQEMKLDPLADRPAQSLSAGQKRRVSLARLLLSERPVWVLDEPTVSLDADIVALFAGILGRHLSSGGVAILTSHIELGLAGASTIDLAAFAPSPDGQVAVGKAVGFDEAFL